MFETTKIMHHKAIRTGLATVTFLLQTHLAFSTSVCSGTITFQGSEGCDTTVYYIDTKHFTQCATSARCTPPTSNLRACSGELQSFSDLLQYEKNNMSSCSTQFMGNYVCKGADCFQIADGNGDTGCIGTPCTKPQSAPELNELTYTNDISSPVTTLNSTETIPEPSQSKTIVYTDPEPIAVFGSPSAQEPTIKSNNTAIVTPKNTQASSTNPKQNTSLNAKETTHSASNKKPANGKTINPKSTKTKAPAPKSKGSKSSAKKSPNSKTSRTKANGTKTPGSKSTGSKTSRTAKSGHPTA